MMATALAWTLALMATEAPPPAPPSSVPPPPAVRLTPVRCADLPDAAVRAPLRVELRQRLLADDAPDQSDFLLVSIACNGSNATVLAVRQNDAVAAVRRLVPLADVAPEARPRELALATVELVHVADLRDADVREATPPPTTVRTTPPSPPSPRSWTPMFSASVLYWGGYLSNNFFATDGASLRIGVEHGPERPPSPSWQWALTSELTAFGGPYQSAFMGGLLALIQRRGTVFVPELGLGARMGWVSDFPTAQTTTLTVAGGPVASAGVTTRLLPGLSSDLILEAGYDFHGPGAWLIPHLGLTLRF
jgi:hypothetical protein